MNRTVVLSALVALITPSARCLAQAPATPPVIRPKVTELGEFRDTTLRAVLTPWEAALSPRGTLIAYINRDDVLCIWNVSTHSSRVVLTGYSENVVWSPAGDAIAFSHEGDQGSQQQVWMQRLNPVTGESIGSVLRVSLTSITGNAPQFSPDGKSIAFPRHDSGERSSLVVVPAAGGTERVLTSGYHIRNLRWAVDGGAVYYVCNQDSATTKAVLSRVAVNGGAPQPVHGFTGASGAPAVSADNRVVTQAAVVAGVQAVRIGDLNGRALAMLSIPAGVRVGDWSDGAYRQVGVREAHPRGLRIINVADGKARELIDSTADVQAVAWFENGRRFAAIAFYDLTGVLVTMNADGTDMRKIPLASQPNRSLNLFAPPVENLRVSPDGRYAVYVGGPSTGLGGSSLELVELSTAKQQTIARAKAITQPFWHRDSRSIRYGRITEVARTDPRWNSVHDVSLDGTDTLVRTFPNSQYPNANWMMGVNHVSNFRGNAYTLMRLDGSPDQVLLRASIGSPGAISPDGRSIAVSPGSEGDEHGARKIILLSTKDGTQRTVNLPFTEIGCGPFSPDGRYLYCNGRETDSGPQTLYEVPVDEAKPRLIARSDSREIRGAIALSPDGKWILQTVAGVRRAAFVSLDFTDGMTRLLSSSQKP